MRLALALLLTLFCSVTAHAQTVADVRVGHWARAKGSLDSDGRFQVTELEILEPEKHDSIIGTLEKGPSSNRLLLLGQQIHVSSKTKYRNVSFSGLVGSRVKVEGRWRGPQKFSARTVSSRNPGRDRIEGRVDAVDFLHDGTVRLQIMNFDLRVPEDFPLDQDSPVTQFELIDPRVLPKTDERAQRDDDDDIRGSIRLLDNLTLGGQLEYRYRNEGDHDLDNGDDKDRIDNQVAIRAEVVYQATDRLHFLAGVRHQWRHRNDEDEAAFSNSRTRLNEAYGYYQSIGSSWIDVQLGRQDFDEQREWLYDQNLDGLRLIVDRPKWRGEVSYTSTLSGGNRRDESSRNLIAYFSNNNARRHIGGYLIDRNDRSRPGDHPLHIGARAYGEFTTGFHTWTEVAVLRGESDGRGNSGYGFDLGATWAPWGKNGLNFTAGYALGSGDADTAGTNGNFRQTGLQDNNGRLLGVTSFRYYGELVDPELSNLSIFTAGIGSRFAGGKNSLDLVFHKYDQVEAVNSLLDSSLDADPNGISKDLGWEVDLVFGSRALKDWAFEVVLGTFVPGDAFPDGDIAWLARFQARYLF